MIPNNNQLQTGKTETRLVPLGKRGSLSSGASFIHPTSSKTALTGLVQPPENMEVRANNLGLSFAPSESLKLLPPRVTPPILPTVNPEEVRKALGATLAAAQHIAASSHTSMCDIMRLHKAETAAALTDLLSIQKRGVDLIQFRHEAETQALERENANLRHHNTLLQWQVTEQIRHNISRPPMPPLEHELNFITSIEELQGLRWKMLDADRTLFTLSENGSADFFSVSRRRASLIESNLLSKTSEGISLVFYGIEQSLSVALDIYELIRRDISPLRISFLHDYHRHSPCNHQNTLQLGAYADSLRHRFGRNIEINNFSSPLTEKGHPCFNFSSVQMYSIVCEDWLHVPHAVWTNQDEISWAQPEEHELRRTLVASGTLFIEDAIWPSLYPWLALK